ncbi:MAG: CPBP family intramembrane glutamic endopeptidase [Clostridiaceae bacterium]
MELDKAVIKKRLTIYIALTIALTCIVYLLIPALGIVYGSGKSVAVLMAVMFVPATCNVLTRLVTKEGFKNMYLHPHFKGNLKYYLLAFFGPVVLIFLSAVVYFLVFPGSYDPELTALKGLIASSGKTGLSPASLLLVQTAVFVVIGPIVNIIPTMGEELGWRGYLLPKLRTFFTDRIALVITGVIWGIWHVPAIAMGHNYGTAYAGYPWSGIVAMIVFCVVLGIIEGYISIKLESAVPAAMIHSAVNAGAGLPVYLAKGGTNPLLGPAINGLAGGLPFIVLAVILFIVIGNKLSSGESNLQCNNSMIK